MTLIKSISGIRGTIGGTPDEALTPLDVVKFTSAYGEWMKKRNPDKKELKVVVGRDARPSGQNISNMVVSTLQNLGIDVVDAGLSTTPTVEMAVVFEQADGGIILTASHNPIEWNALKLLNEKGEFISASDGSEILKLVADENFEYCEVNSLGSYQEMDFIPAHVDSILNLDLVKAEIIKNRNFKVAIDPINSSGAIAIPALLEALGVTDYTLINQEPNGMFAHNPEPLPQNLTEITKLMSSGEYDLGIVVDPDVDRLAFISNDGSYFGEEYTLVAVADYILKNQTGNTVSNLSSSQALKVVTEKAGGEYHASAVGEVNVVKKMKDTNAVIGGEGNGGIIYPELHYGRDALVGIALFLSYLADSGLKTSELRSQYPSLHISKDKIQLTPEVALDELLVKIKEAYSDQETNTEDGLKIIFTSNNNGDGISEWVHLRKSNTEPIIRIYAESLDSEKAELLTEKIKTKIAELS